jgi:crotonobetainyl-CoA:carnitine CoA-transferase CaiB-like acyl-CoA transferase
MVNQVDEAFAYARTLGLEPVVAVGGVDIVANPLRLSATPATYRLAPPTLGEHGDEIRADLSKEMTRDG